jgi:putative monooxygenase
MAAWALIRAANAPHATPSPGVDRMRLTGEETGSSHLGTGITTFEPGTGLYWHYHVVDESVTVLEGEPICEVGGDRPLESHSLKPFDTAFIPARTPHRFFNPTDRDARIAWSYPAGRVERYRVNPDGSPAEEGASS